MKSKDVLRVLNIIRQTLTKYAKEKIVRVNVLPNKRYDYNDEDVYKFLNKDVTRKTFIYALTCPHRNKKLIWRTKYQF